MLSSKVLDEFKQLTQTSGFVLLPDRTIIRIQGKDRLSFLHKFCTADVTSLVAGKATEAFILNLKGKLLSHVYLLSSKDELLLNTTGGQFGSLHEHLDKYIMREDVRLIDASESFVTMFVAGPDSEANLRSAYGIVPEAETFVDVPMGSLTIGVARVDLAGIGFLMMIPVSLVQEVQRDLVQNGITDCSLESFHILRVENKTPWFGIDATDENLPQELQRDQQAICFTKGCYLGQETVARIDALGHVNQYLVGLNLNREASPGTKLVAENKPVGKLTSVAWSPTRESWIALGYVKRKWSVAGTVLEFDGGLATVV